MRYQLKARRWVKSVDVFTSCRQLFLLFNFTGFLSAPAQDPFELQEKLRKPSLKKLLGIRSSKVLKEQIPVSPGREVFNNTLDETADPDWQPFSKIIFQPSSRYQFRPVFGCIPASKINRKKVMRIHYLELGRVITWTASRNGNWSMAAKNPFEEDYFDYEIRCSRVAIEGRCIQQAN